MIERSNLVNEQQMEQILRCILFRGLTQQEVRSVLPCLDARVKVFDKDTYIVNEQGSLSEVGIVLRGGVTIIKEDYWGNRAILSKLSLGEMFGEALACLNQERLDISVVASEQVEILFINYKKIIHTCSQSCRFHVKLIENMLWILASKNRMLTRKIEHLVKKSTREKLLSYLSTRAKEVGENTFEIPFNRQELADYLSVERSAMSSEISKLKKDGILDCKKNSFTLKNNP